MKERLDIVLVKRGLVKTRSQAAQLIERGAVLLDGQVCKKASQTVDEDSKIELTEKLRFVSRAGEKLAHAIESFNLDFKDLIVLDVGSSTGGFTDCAIQNGARRVVAVDVGTDQFDKDLAKDSRVELHEQTDIRKFETQEKFDAVVTDVSFISLAHIIPLLKKLLKEKGIAVLLIKPQFEVGKENLNKKGVVTDEMVKKEVVEKIKKQVQEEGFEIKGIIPSPILGGDGNEEYLLVIQ